MAQLPSELAAINKRSVHRAMEIMGLRAAIRAGTEIQALALTTESQQGKRDEAKKLGLMARRKEAPLADLPKLPLPALVKLKDAGVWLAGTSDHKASQSLYAAKLNGPLAIVLGAEGDGIRHLTAETCDFLVRIPMLGQVPCLNVSVSAGVCLFEAVRQRGHR